MVILKIHGAEEDVAGIDDLIGLKRLWNQTMQFLRWLDDDSAIAQGKYSLLFHATVAFVIWLKSAKRRSHVPTPRHLPESRQPRLFLLRIRLEVGDHFAPSSLLRRTDKISL